MRKITCTNLLEYIRSQKILSLFGNLRSIDKDLEKIRILQLELL
jgi:hypothetical protein